MVYKCSLFSASSLAFITLCILDFKAHCGFDLHFPMAVDVNFNVFLAFVLLLFKIVCWIPLPISQVHRFIVTVIEFLKLHIHSGC